MSTLSEIAMNHARMVKRLAEESVAPLERQPLVVGSFDVCTMDTPHHLPLHFLMDAQDRNIDLISAAI
ncbi:hypothetical protein M2D63_017900 [Pseudomonas sp. BJa5]|uniref:hypothetical protein n=1 Tax=Pseudomonas sp. BJa5 TaxID=2936270 RepID=UPI002559B6EA|nr:hypothetical protein [Pseudomonas sp. BGr12]MDL2422992.1 hypothetical protein [Pseudomonas sp. BGr12]